MSSSATPREPVATTAAAPGVWAECKPLRSAARLRQFEAPAHRWHDCRLAAVPCADDLRTTMLKDLDHWVMNIVCEKT